MVGHECHHHEEANICGCVGCLSALEMASDLHGGSESLVGLSEVFNPAPLLLQQTSTGESRRSQKWWIESVGVMASSIYVAVCVVYWHLE